MATRKPPRARALSASEFFALQLPRFTMHAAHTATRVAYSTILDITHGRCEPTKKTLARLETWSRDAIAEHGVYLSAALTLGFEEPATGTDG